MGSSLSNVVPQQSNNDSSSSSESEESNNDSSSSSESDWENDNYRPEEHLLDRHLQGALLNAMNQEALSSRAQQLLVGLQATGNESEQLQAVIEMCQLLVMGNEDTLPGFPIKQVTPALIQLLNMEHNFDMMNHACRALTYMMEALPRSSAVVVDAVPSFLEKLQEIQCMDVAEQSLTALNMLSRKHSKAILQARGVSSCLTFIDFFSCNAQRAALSITANCFQNLTLDEFHFASDALPILTSRLTTHGDKKCVESVCLAFSRLVDCFANDSTKLKEIASHGLLTNIQQLLAMSPPILSGNPFIMVIRMLSLLCTNCPELAVTLLQNNIANTLCYLLTNSTDPPLDQIELVSRSPQEIYEITCLVGELMPVLPIDGIFAIDSVLLRPVTSSQQVLVWQWQDDRKQWHSYSHVECRIIEASHQAGDDEISLNINGNPYTLDFHSMQQINDNTGTMRQIIRRMLPALPPRLAHSKDQSLDERATCLKENEALASTLIKSLFILMYEVYNSSAGPAVRYKCLRALLRMIHFSSPELLTDVLKSQAVSSHLATMLSSTDLKIVVSAIQMVDLLMRKLPDLFSVYFRREGVMYQLKRISETPTASPLASNSNTPLNLTTKSKDDCILSDSSLSSMPSIVNSFDLGASLGAGSILNSSFTDWINLGASGGTSTSVTPPLPSSPSLSSSAIDKLPFKKATSRMRTGGSAPRRPVKETRNPKLTLSDFLIRSTGFSSGRESMRSSTNRNKQATVNPTSKSSSSLTSTNSAKTSTNTSFISIPTAKTSVVAPTKSCLSSSKINASKTASSSKTASTSTPTTKSASFLSNFNPVRWGRCNSSPNETAKDKSTSSSTSFNSNTSASSTASIIASANSAHREYIKSWIKDSATRLVQEYFSEEIKTCSDDNQPVLTVMNRLIAAIKMLDLEPENSIESLTEISRIVGESDISPFEVIHSGLVLALLNYLTNDCNDTTNNNNDITSKKSLADVKTIGADQCDSRKVPPRILSSSNASDALLGALTNSSNNNEITDPLLNNSPKNNALPRHVRIRNFLHVFLGCSLNPLSVDGYSESHLSAFSALVSKLNGCVNQLEQFPVKVHDLPGSLISSSSRGGSTSAIKFFNTHQLKCNLQRHPDTSRVKQWRGGPVKVDPLALVQAIERYLVIRGYGRLRDVDSDEHSDDDISDDDIDDTLAAVTVSQSSQNHKLEFTIGDHVLPYNMTVYQAVRQFAGQQDNSSTSDIDTESDVPISHSSIWLQTHTIYYRPIIEESSKSSSKRSSNKKSILKKKATDIIPSNSNLIGGQNPVLESQLSSHLPSTVTIKDPSIEVLTLLRVLYALNREYGSFYPSVPSPQSLPMSEFVNTKLAAKANRQLQDPLVIMTGNLPQWLPQIAYSCPFLFPFETRQLLFYAVSFDRDRALQRLMDTTPDLTSNDSTERVTPRLERRKRTVSREDILKQAETVMNDLANSRAMLEIQYENEVGTGLGPTLEFYALVSKELQKASLELWRGDSISLDNSVNESVPSIKYMTPGSGLYPNLLPKNTKSAQLTKIKNKFKFLGKFMAKAVMDSRMLDLGLHENVYKWLLCEEKSLSFRDVMGMDQALGISLKKLLTVILEKRTLQEDAVKNKTNARQLRESLEALRVDGCKIEELCLDYTLPGYSNIELKRYGEDTYVTIDDLQQYLELVVEWLVREGVWRQMEALREGFETVFPISNLKIFYPDELEQVFCGSMDSDPWDVKQLADCCRPDHGYNHDSRAVKFLLEILSEYSAKERRLFLQFVTGSPRLPVGGLRSLGPQLTIVRRAFDSGQNPDDFLPSVMTCVNYLKLPDYSTIEIMREKLKLAALEGQKSFHLS